MVYQCKECDCIFDEPVKYTDIHGLDGPPYEEWTGCPTCGDTYRVAINCSCCGGYITDTYVKTTDGHMYCDSCYAECNAGEDR